MPKELCAYIYKEGLATSSVCGEPRDAIVHHSRDEANACRHAFVSQIEKDIATEIQDLQEGRPASAWTVCVLHQALTALSTKPES